KIGSGTFVAEPLPETFLSAQTAKAEPRTERPPRLSERVRGIPDQRVGKQFDFGIAGPPGVTFVPAVAALDEFPIETWEGRTAGCAGATVVPRPVDRQGITIARSPKQRPPNII